MFGTEILQVPDRTADITAKELTLKLPPNHVNLVEMLSGTAPSILVARMSGFGGLEKGLQFRHLIEHPENQHRNHDGGAAFTLKLHPDT